MNRSNYEYKKSGVLWLGDIPDHWEIKKVKHIARFYTGWTPPSGNDEYYDGEYPWANISDLGTKYLETSVRTITQEAIDTLRMSISKKGSLLFSFKLSIGLVSMLSKDLFTNEAIATFPPNNRIETTYLYYLAPVAIPMNAGINIYNAPMLNQDSIKNAVLVYPPLDEQQSIASFLDRETARIDALIQKKERMIELLKEKRIALITQAVTKGLDPNVPMKDSGIEWLGEVPEHWEVLPIKYIVSTPVTDGPHETPEILDEGVPFISAESIKGGKIDFELKRGFISIEDDLRYSKKYKPMMNDIYVIKSGATTGNSAMVETDIEFNIWSPLAVIRCNKAIADPHFVFLYVNSNEFITAIQLFWSFGTQQNIGMNIIENLQVPLPPISEQINICKGSKMELERIETLQNRIADSITLLREYRASLIHHAVTGKFNLRGYDAQAQ